MNDSTEQGNLAEQQLMLIRQLDDVQDDAPELRDFVRASLRVIKTALGSTNSFVAYWDEYARVRSKTEGPATSQLTKDIEQLFEVTRNKYVTEKDTGFVFEQPYFAVPSLFALGPDSRWAFSGNTWNHPERLSGQGSTGQPRH